MGDTILSPQPELNSTINTSVINFISPVLFVPFSLMAKEKVNRFDYLSWDNIGWDIGDWSRGILIPSFVLIVTTIVYLVIYSWNKNRKEKQTFLKRANEAFANGIEKCRLNTYETEMLKRLLRHDQAALPQVIFQSYQFFEQCVQTEMELVLSENMSKEQLEEHEATLATLRKKIGFQFLPLEYPLASTRNISTGQRASLFVGSNKKPVIQNLVVVKNTESFFRVQFNVAKEDHVQQLHPGERIRFVFTRQDDGFYGISMPVLAFSPRGFIDLRHTLQIKRSQLRQHVRVQVDLPLKFRLIKTMDPSKSEVQTGVQCDAKLFDISAGGLCFVSDHQLKTGDMLSLIFNLGSVAFSGVSAQIIRVTIQSEKKGTVFKHHVQFNDLNFNKRDKISKFVFEKLRLLSLWR